MTTATAAARSGLLASVARLNAAASNIANSSTIGPLSQTPPAQAVANASGVYQPVDVVLTSVGSGTELAGVAAGYRSRLPAYVPQYDLSAPFADAEGMVAAPNVDLAAEAIGVLEASLLFKANLIVLKTADEIAKSVLDTRA